MYYISKFDRREGKYGVTDTTDGVTDILSAADVLYAVNEMGLEINGVSGKTINVVSMTNQVMNVGFAGVEKQVDALIASWSVEDCMEVGRKASFVSKLKKKPEAEVRSITKSYVYPDSIKSAVQNAAQYTNQMHEVDVKDMNAVMQALASNVCLVLQLKTNNTLTSFVCSAGLSILDKVYEPLFFDAMYLTKQLYDYTYKADRLRPRREAPLKRSPDLLNVFSCSLRFRNDGKRHDKGNMVLSSPFYTVNPPRLFCMYILDNPGKLGDTLTAEFHRGQHTGVYDFDFEIFKEVIFDVQTRHNRFEDPAEFQRYLNVSMLKNGVTLQDVMDRYQRDWNYMMKLRNAGLSFIRTE